MEDKFGITIDNFFARKRPKAYQLLNRTWKKVMKTRHIDAKKKKKRALYSHLEKTTVVALIASNSYSI